jgi:hypothetical protein
LVITAQINLVSHPNQLRCGRIGSPDSGFAKYLELLNAFELLEDDEQRSLLQNSTSTEQPSKTDAQSTGFAPEAKIDNSFAEHIASAMAKRDR